VHPKKVLAIKAKKSSRKTGLWAKLIGDPKPAL
jgi:hypothetical protein